MIKEISDGEGEAMKKIIRNLGYFLRETKIIINLNLLSNLFSILSMSFIFFLLSMVISGGFITNQIVELIQGEAEINIFYNEDIDDSAVSLIADNIKNIEGILEVSIIDEEQAYDRMLEVMGEDTSILDFFDYNPFNAFIEAKIDLNLTESIIEQLEEIENIEYIRDNQSVLNRIKNISNITKLLGTFILIAVGISTLVITSHIIKQGIYSNREEINTLKLLGAPQIFIVSPFILVGLMLTLIAGILAVLLNTVTLKYFYLKAAGQLPFIPLPSIDLLIKNNFIIMLVISFLLGIFGSLFGLKSAKNN